MEVQMSSGTIRTEATVLPLLVTALAVHSEPGGLLIGRPSRGPGSEVGFLAGYGVDDSDMKRAAVSTSTMHSAIERRDAD